MPGASRNHELPANLLSGDLEKIARRVRTSMSKEQTGWSGPERRYDK
jgi:hypothetical protein